MTDDHQQAGKLDKWVYKWYFYAVAILSTADIVGAVAGFLMRSEHLLFYTSIVWLVLSGVFYRCAPRTILGQITKEQATGPEPFSLFRFVSSIASIASFAIAALAFINYEAIQVRREVMKHVQYLEGETDRRFHIIVDAFNPHPQPKEIDAAKIIEDTRAAERKKLSEELDAEASDELALIAVILWFCSGFVWTLAYDWCVVKMIIQLAVMERQQSQLVALQGRIVDLLCRTVNLTETAGLISGNAPPPPNPS